MELNVVCSEDQSNPAVCCCFCRFPLPALCEEHLAKHTTDTEGFLHFHLPLAAQHHISTREIKALYEPWLYKLYRAGALLKENNEDLKQFEDQIEAAKQEILFEFETEVAQAKQKVANLQEAFNAQLQTAIRDTSEHAIEQWTPEPESLSSLIWNFDANNYSSLKLFGLWVGRQPSVRVLQMHIASSLPSLAQFNQNVDELKEQVLQKTQLELVDSNRENEELKVENAKLREEIQNLQAKCINLSETIESLKDSTETHINRIKKEKEKIQFDCNAEVKILKLELAKLRQTNEEQAKKPNENIDALNPDSKEMQLVREQGQEANRYEKRAASLREAWNSITNKAEEYQITVSVGIALGDVLGVRLCLFAEAESVIDESLRVVTARNPTSEEAMRLQTLKAAAYFHNEELLECEAVCMKTLETFTSAKFDAELYMATMFYLIFVLCDRCNYEKAETTLIDWSAKHFWRNNNSLKQFLKLYIRANAILYDKKKKAEKAFKKAAQIAAQHFPTSIYAATNLLDLGRYCCDEDLLEEAKATLLQAISIFSMHFPFSYYFIRTLNWIAYVFEKSGQLEEACSKLNEAYNISVQCYPSISNIAVNRFDLATVYEKMGRLEDAERTYLQARDFCQVHNPTSHDAAKTFNNLARLYEKTGRIEEALACATSAFDIWNRMKSDEAQRLALPILERLRKPKK